MGISDADYVKELELAVVDRDQRIAALLAKYEPAPPVPMIDGPFCMPNPDQMRRLLDIVTGRYPALLGRERAITDDLLAEFQAAFRYLATLHRTPGEVDTVHSSEHWTTQAREHARRPITLPALAAAVVAANDIDFAAPSPSEWRVHWSFGLMIGSRRGSRPASNEWLRLLQGAALRRPIELPRVREYGSGGIVRP